MLKKVFLSSCILLILVALSSCDNYNKLLKSNDIEKKLEMAKVYYNKGNYFKALPLFEELISVYRGREELEEIYYFYSYCYFGQESYQIAAVNFKNFATYYPASQYAEECHFMHAKCYYLDSPSSKLDQTNTFKAVNAFQLFINTFPNSARIEEANGYIDMLRRKLEIKEYESAELYMDMGNYKAAAVSFENVLKSFPESPEAERVAFLIIKSYHLLAKNSIPSKQEERYIAALEAYNNFTARYPESNYQKDAEALNQASTEALKTLSNK